MLPLRPSGMTGQGAAGRSRRCAIQDRVGAADAFAVVGVGVADLRQLPALLVEGPHPGLGDTPGIARVESLNGVEVNLRTLALHHPLEGPATDAARQHRHGVRGDHDRALLMSLAYGPLEGAPHPDR